MRSGNLALPDRKYDLHVGVRGTETKSGCHILFLRQQGAGEKNSF